MKPATISHLVLSLAAAASAAPAPGATPPPTEMKDQDALFGLIPAGINLAGGVFNSAACIVVTFFLGRNNPLCGDSGSSSVEVGNSNDGGDSSSDSSSSSSSSSSSKSKNYDYDFDYSTNRDGTLKITITPSKGNKCTNDVDADGKDLQEVIKDEAKKCFEGQ